MGEISKISWTDGTLNFWEGCEKVSPGCLHCYAEDRDRRFHGGEHWGKGAPRKLSKSAINEIRRFNAKAAAGEFFACNQCGARRWKGGECCGNHTGPIKRPVFFLISLGDLFDQAIPPQWLADALIEVIKADSMDFMMLTKRMETAAETIGRATTAMSSSWRARVLDWMEGGEIPQNIAIGTTIENATVARSRLDALGQFPAARRFVSAEPLLGPGWENELCGLETKPDLVIVGGESGTKARPMHPDWPLAVEDVCDGLRIPFHFKQWGEWVPADIVEPPPGLNVAGNVVRVDQKGRLVEHGETRLFSRELWRAGKKAAGHAITATGRTRTETMDFPMQPWKKDYLELTGHPLGVRRFHQVAAAHEFLAARWHNGSTLSLVKTNQGIG